MAASNTDYFMKVGRATASTLSSPGYTTGNTSINIGSTTNWPTDTGVTFAIDEVDGTGARISGTYNVFRGVVSGSTQITSLVYAGGDPNRNYVAGATTRVYILVSAYRDNKFTDGILAQHKQSGAHGAITADSITAPIGTFDSIVISGSGSSVGWNPLGATPSTITNNGNHSTDLTFTGVDLTPTLSEGMRLRLTKTVPTQTQVTSLNGTNQYWSKTSPAGMTFTDDFVVTVKVKMTSYGTESMIVTRNNGTNGWFLDVNASGQVQLSGSNASAGNFRRIVSNQSIPLNKWVTITAQLDMSAYTATSTTCYVMIDGVDVPVTLAQSGTNPTTLIQAGNLEVGSYNGGLLPFPGKIAQVAIFNAKVTQAQMKLYSEQSFTGTETSLISAYKFDGNGNDVSTTGNNLTANGSAVATNADSPFGNSGASTTKEYAIVMTKPVYSGGNTTVTVQTPEGCAIPTSGGISSVDYSSASVPFGFPRDSGKWEVTSLSRTQVGQGTPTINTWYNLGNARISVPIGAWELSFNTQMIAGIAGADYADMYTALSSSTSVDTDQELKAQLGGYANQQIGAMPAYKAKRLQTTSTTPYYLITSSAISSAAIYTTGNTVLTARNAYL